MSTTRGNIDAVVALYAENVPPEELNSQQMYCNEFPDCPDGAPDIPDGAPDSPKSPDYYNTDSRDSYLTPVQSTPEPTATRNAPDPGAGRSYDVPKKRPALPTPDNDHRRGSPGGVRRQEASSQRTPRQRNGAGPITIDNSNRLHPGDDVRLPLTNNEPSRSRSNISRQVPITDQDGNIQEDMSDPHALQYSVDDTPPWYLCIFLGFQHFLVMFGATVANPLALADYMCIAKDDYLSKSELMSTIIFCSGIATLLQATLGTRLPIVQGGTFTFVTPSIAILTLPVWKCPVTTSDVTTTAQTPSLVTDVTASATDMLNSTLVGDTEPIWKSRIREIQGAIMVASLFQVVIGFSGILGYIMRWIGPLAIAPTIALAGLALFDVATFYASKQWWITLVTVVLIAMFSQYTKNIGVPCCKYEKNHGFVRISFPLFRLFPVILAVGITWLICIILAFAGVPIVNDNSKTNAAFGIDVFAKADWFRIPYPGQWGMPTVSAAGVFGILAGVLASMLESLGDYYACARLSKVPPPPMHAVNRGIGIEGIGCVIAGAFGSGSGTTSYSENIGAIGITKVASRRVIQVAAIIMLIFGVFGKFGAIFVTIPDPVIGGVFIVMFGMVAAVGISNLQFVDLNSSRNLFIIGFSFFFGLALPKYINENPESISTGNLGFDQIVTVLLKTNMFVGGLAGFVLDNTIPGTDEERGLTRWRQQLIKKKKSRRGAIDEAYYKRQKAIYEIAALTNILKKWSWTRYIPFLPTFDEDLLSIKRKFPKLRKKKAKHTVNDEGSANNIEQTTQDTNV